MNLENASAWRCRFGASDLHGANMVGIDLRRADLRFTQPRGANLTGARYDAQTRWPTGFDAVKSGAMLVR